MPRVIVATVAAIGAFVIQSFAAPQQVFRSTADVVPLFVTAAEKSGRLVTDLTKDDFQVFDNGKPQPLTQFDNSPQPIRLIVLIDISGSMEGNLRLLRGASEELFRHLGERDLMRVGTFGDEISISPTFTRDPAAIAAWLPREIPPNARTPLWGAADQAMGEFSAVTEGRRVILILSDGKDSGPQFGKKFLSPIEIGDRAQRDDVMIYGVGVYGSLAGAMRSGAPTIGGMLASTFPDPGLGGVALDTGGGYIELRGRDDLSAVFGRVIDELHQQYLLGFAPPARDGKTHKIEVKIKRADVKPRVRKTYVAPKDGR
jgi:Ca-activated chloride channel family protein